MSHMQNKDALFDGKGKPSGTVSSSSTPSEPVKPVSKTAGLTTNLSAGGLSNAAKLKKIEEAREYSEKGMNYLKTSMFQWKPDHVAAAPMFERSADLYQQANESKNAMLMLIKAAESHESTGAMSATAIDVGKAAQLAKAMGDQKQFIELQKRAAECWGIHGDLQRYGETLAGLAKELESSNITESMALYKKGREYVKLVLIVVYCVAMNKICPDNMPKDQISGVHANFLEIIRNALSCYVKAKKLKEALELSKRMIVVFQAFDLESSVCKAMLTVTVLQLALEDVVAAQNTYLQEHLSDTKYLHSKECEVADLLILALNNQDIEQLDKAKMHPHINYLDHEVQRLIKNLSIFGDYERDEAPSGATVGGGGGGAGGGGMTGGSSSSGGGGAIGSEKASLFGSSSSGSKSKTAEPINLLPEPPVTKPSAASAVSNPPAPPASAAAEEEEQEEGGFIAAELDALHIEGEGEGEGENEEAEIEAEVAEFAQGERGENQAEESVKQQETEEEEEDMSHLL